MAQVQGEEIYLSHSGQEVDDNIDEVQAARGSEASLSARLAAQDVVIADKWGYTRQTIGGTGDFNAVVSSGYYRYNGSPANAPTGASGEFGVLMVYAAGSYISQVAHCFLSSRRGIYSRTSTNSGSTWTEWSSLQNGKFDLTLAGSPLVASEYSYSCIVTGDIVTICVRLVLGAELAVNTSRNLFRIPSDYRPPVTCAGTGYADSKLRTFWVNTSGDIKIRIDEAIPSGASINANFCYSYKAANWQTVTPASLQSAPASLMQAGRIDAELTGAENDEAEEEER